MNKIAVIVALGGLTASGALAQPGGGWQELKRVLVNDRADFDVVLVGGDQMYRVVKVCAERQPIRIRRAGVRLENGTYQRLFLPLVLQPGSCSKEIKLQGAPRRIHFFDFDYEAWSAGIARGTIVIQGLGDTPR
jgi:hypothetical protein